MTHTKHNGVRVVRHASRLAVEVLVVYAIGWYYNNFEVNLYQKEKKKKKGVCTPTGDRTQISSSVGERDVHYTMGAEPPAGFEPATEDS